VRTAQQLHALEERAFGEWKTKLAGLAEGVDDGAGGGGGGGG
jgi:hypothetical protein